MPVDTKHPDYIAMAPVWRDCRDAAGGQRLVHAAGELHLPKLAGESAKQYKARLARAAFFNATWRTVVGLRGMLFRKDPDVKVSPNTEPMLDDVTQSGVSLTQLGSRVTEECLVVGRVGLLVDYPLLDTEGMTVAQVEAANLRPKMAMYQAEAAINWDCGWINNKHVLTRVVVTETAVKPDPKDEFGKVMVRQFRVLDLVVVTLDNGDSTLAYRVRLYEKDRKADKLVGGPYFPKMNGAYLPYIPFVFIGVDNVTPEVETPPLVDLVDVNFSHFQSTADIEHGAHKTALPQPWATGLSANPATNPDSPHAAPPTFYMGGGEIWLHPDIAGQFGMLEYTGQGLEAIETRLQRKEAYMAVLGARMLEDQKKAVETAEAAGMHRSGEQASLTSQGKTASSGINIALGWFDAWAGGSGQTEFALNNEFLPAGLSAQEITALVAAWQAGSLSSQELFAKFQEGGVIRESTEFETHEAQIENAPPRLSAPPVTPGAGQA